MSIKIDRDALLKPLVSVSGIVERRHTLPILSNLLLEAKQDKLSITATDLEMQISLSVEKIGDEELSTTISAKKLLDICRSLPESSEINLIPQEGRIQLKAGKSRFNLQTLPATDYPVMTSAPGSATTVVRIGQNKLKNLFKKVEFAMAQQDIRYYLNGLLFEINENKINLVGTDGHRLSFITTTLEESYEKQELILPRKTVVELCKLLGDDESELVIEIRAGQIKFNLGQIKLISKIIDGKFPDYSRVIPSSSLNSFTIDRKSILFSMQRVSILSYEKLRGIRLILNENNLKLISTNNEQEEAEEELEIDYVGDCLDMGFNVTYIIDVLNNIENEKITFNFTNASSSCLITIPDNDDYKYVVMPMRI
ncbi:MAG: DNA polymerase III subunit beta [Methylophilaceae bacterium]|nr:DNA polymerase III subunit beta [Methylophilaceae bacterium]